ncbi:Nn.00g072030.m01.CDS01 [Neocucurbitaria sp. VM-36]
MSLLTEPSQHPVPRSKAPWTVKAETYFLFLSLRELPKGVYDPLEEAWGDEGLGEFKGGLGTIMIVRYSHTPVGPYDELLLIPGTFTVPRPSNGPPKLPKKALRIARIYVSQRTATYNGRLNWNIPKHLARFSFSAPPTLKGQSPPLSLDVEVFPPGTKDGDGASPFFACTLKPWRWVPSVPVNSRWIPMSMVHVQPPIPESEDHRAAVQDVVDGPEIDAYDVSPKGEMALCVGTDRWTSFDIGMRVPRAKGCWVSIGETGTEDGENQRYFPQGLRSWSVGGWMEEGVLEIAEPLEWKR